MKNKGFTLIELLAVIVILAIIAVIAIPRILNVVEEAKKGAAKSSVLGYIDALEKQIMMNDLKNDNAILKGTTHNISDLKNKVKIKGEIPKSGTVTIDQKGKVTSYTLVIDNYKVTTENASVDNPLIRQLVPIIVKYHANGGTGEMANTTDIVVNSTFTPPTKKRFKEWNTKADGTGDTYTNETPLVNNIDLYAIWEEGKPTRIVVPGATHKGIVYMDPTDIAKKCDALNSISTTGTKEGCMKFYIYDDSGDNYKMILDHNTTVISAYSSNISNADYNAARTTLNNDTENWDVDVSIISAPEIVSIVGISGYNGCYAIRSFGSSDNTAYANQTDAQKRKQESFAWLFDYTKNCKANGCDEEDSETPGYWTSTPASDHGQVAHLVSSAGALAWGMVPPGYGGGGIRPVVTIAKTEING